MYGKRFQKELDIIDKALTDKRGEEELRLYLNDSVAFIADVYIKENDLSSFSRDELMTAAWTYLPMALKRYRGRADQMLQGKNDVFYFITYFNWFIRQGILEYVNNRS